MKCKKKVLFYNGSLRMGGIERVMIDVIQNLDLSKMEIDLVIEDGIRSLNIFENDVPKEIKITYLKDEDMINKTAEYRAKKSNILFKILYNLRMNYENYIKRKKIKEIARKQYDVIIDFDMGLTKYIDYFKNGKKITWIHSSIEKWYKRKDKIRRLGKRLKKYDTIVTICDEMKEKTIFLFPFLKSKIIRIYNPFCFSRISSQALVEDDLYKKFKDQKYVISVMRLTEDSKDFDTLISAWEMLLKKGIYIKLYILGEGPDRIKIQEKINKHNLSEYIILIGNVKNPYIWMKNAELLVHSSKYEGFGLVLVEGLILGKHVISSSCEMGPKEILENGRLGDLYPVGDYKILARLVEERLKNRNNNLQNVYKSIEKYRKENIIKEYEKIIMD